MRKPEDGKKVYDNIEIPAELNDVVNNAIHSMDKEKSLKKHRSRNTVRIFRSVSYTHLPVHILPLLLQL